MDEIRIKLPAWVIDELSNRSANYDRTCYAFDCAADRLDKDQEEAEGDQDRTGALDRIYLELNALQEIDGEASEATRGYLAGGLADADAFERLIDEMDQLQPGDECISRALAEYLDGELHYCQTMDWWEPQHKKFYNRLRFELGQMIPFKPGWIWSSRSGRMVKSKPDAIIDGVKYRLK